MSPDAQNLLLAYTAYFINNMHKNKNIINYFLIYIIIYIILILYILYIMKCSVNQ